METKRAKEHTVYIQKKIKNKKMNSKIKGGKEIKKGENIKKKYSMMEIQYTIYLVCFFYKNIPNKALMG